jgi:hypothetical protein
MVIDIKEYGAKAETPEVGCCSGFDGHIPDRSEQKLKFRGRMRGTYDNHIE